MKFPQEVLVIIFQYLPFSEKLNVSLTCKQWRKVCVEYLCSKRTNMLDFVEVLVGTLDNTVEPLIQQLQQMLPGTTLRIHDVFHFDNVYFSFFFHSILCIIKFNIFYRNY